ncbi:MAG: ABC transporter substrate-binding protein [Gaiellaceae bacterium]
MRKRALWIVAALALILVLPACGGDDVGGGEATGTGGETEESEVVKGGILRLGTIDYIDSLNPFNYIESQAYNAFIMIYPQLVQYTTGDEGLEIEGDWAESWETSADGKDWTFTLKPGTKWSDGQPMTADDAAWTINTIVKFAAGPTAVAAPALTHVEGAEAVDDTTLVIHYAQPVGNVLAQLEQLFIIPRHAWEQFATGKGKGLKTHRPEDDLDSMVTGGAYTIRQYERKGTTVYVPDPNYWDEPSNAEAVALTYYTNADSMIADLKGGELDWVDQVPFNAVDVLKEDENIVVNEVPGAETTNITWNANPKKPTNRELLDPQVKKALSMCVDREKVIEVVFNGYAETVESLPGHISPLENPNLGPLEYDCEAGNQMLDDLGYAKGSDGIRVAPATTGQYAEPEHKMEYEIVTPTSTDFNVDRSFEIVQEGFAAAGVEVTQKVGGDSSATYAIETGDNCDPAKSTGYDKFDIAMWDWVGYIDPDFMLSVVTKGQWCSWSDTGWDDPKYDELYQQQGTTVDPEERERIVHEMQQIIYDNFLYTQLTNHVYIDAHRKEWDGFETELNAYSKRYYTTPHQVG